MPLTAGSRLGPYEVLSPIGAGGMGEVYRAHDPRLGRDVAIKVLPADRVGDADRRRRFVQEAHAASAINHPHIITIYEIESAEGVDFIVMEYVLGKSLDALIPRHGLQLGEVLRIATPVADALAAAHGRGIIHRDLKPANVMVGTDGAVKVLDFGLAKLTSVESATEPDTDLTQTANLALSRPGTIAGTVAYMSPEQAMSGKVDARSDIFSFGATLYEMVTGERAFAGKSTAETLAAVVRAQPSPPSALVPSLPRDLEKIIVRCLQKDPDRRLQHMLDVKVELREIQEELDRASRSETAPPPTTRRRFTRAHLLALAGRHRITVALAGIALLAGVVGGGWRLTRRSQDSTLEREVTVTQLTANPPDLPVTSAQISPDGRYLAYADPTGIQIRVIASGDTQRLPDTRGVDIDGWSDDGTTIRGKSCEGATCTGWNLSLVGGARHRSGARWASSDITVFAPDGSRFLRYAPAGQELWVEFVNGAPSQRLVRITEKGDSLLSASWSRDATRVFFTRNEEPWFIESVSANGGSVSQVFKAADGQLIEEIGAPLRDGRLLAVVANMAHSKIAILAVPVAATHDGASDSSRRLVDWKALGSTGEFRVGQLSASSDGTRVGYVTETSHTDLYVARFDARAGRLVDAPRRITIDERGNLLTDWTPDGRALLFESLSNGTRDIFIQSLTAQLAQPLVTGPGDQLLGRVTSDGQWVLFIDTAVRRGHGPVRIMRVSMSGGLPQQVYSSTTSAFPRCSAHGQCVLFEERGDEIEISVLDPVRGKGRKLATIPRDSCGDALLADGKDAAFVVCDARPVNRIRIVSLTGGPTHDVVVDRAGSLGCLDAAPDGSGLFSNNVTNTASELLFIRPNGSSAVLWTTMRTTGAVGCTISSPDGTRLAMDVITAQTNAWMLTNF